MIARETITSEDLTVKRLLDDFYVVPAYQRQYVWEQKHVELLLNDILDRYQTAGEKSEYFIGSIVTSHNSQTSSYELIDGQQRVTTLFLTLCAIRDALLELQSEVSEDLKGQIRKKSFDKASGKDVERYRVVLNYEGGQGVLEAIGDESRSIARRQLPIKNASTQKLLDAYDEARAFLTEHFDRRPTEIQHFWWYLTNNVKLIRVETGSLTDALRVFETINDRGIGLDPMDLLKNLLFMKATDTQYEKLNARWEKLSELLYKREKPLRFLRYFIMSTYDSGLIRADESYEWLKNNYKEFAPELEADPVAFADKLIEVAECFGRLLEGRNPDNSENRYLKNLSLLAGSARQHLILLLAGRYLPKDVFDRLSKEVEDLFFIFIITGTPKNEFERRFVGWARDIRQIRDLEGLEQLLKDKVIPFKEEKAKEFRFALENFKELSLPKYRRKYVLAKLAQYVNELAYPNTGWSDLDKLMGSGYEIEHILPESLPESIRQSFDRPEEIEEYINRLGNLTLLEKTINSSIGNASYEAKRREYVKSSILLTRVIASSEPMGKDTTFNKILGKFSSFEVWDSAAIEHREKELIALAHEVWGVKSQDPWPERYVAI